MAKFGIFGEIFDKICIFLTNKKWHFWWQNPLESTYFFLLFFLFSTSPETRKQTKIKNGGRTIPPPGMNFGQISARSVEGFSREGHFRFLAI